MQFEILNTIQFLVGLLVCIVIWYQVKKKLTELKWKYFFVGFLVVILFTHQQFYTLTEKEDVKRSQNIMLKQTSDIHNSIIVDEYLAENTKPKKNLKLETETLLKEQQNKSKELAKQVEQQHKEK